MNRNVVIGIVVVLALGVVGWWYWAMMLPAQQPTDEMPADAAAGGDAIEQSSMDLSGTWQSKQDPRFTRTFTVGGAVTDEYEGIDSATVTGTWTVVEDPATERPELPVIENAQVIKVQFEEEVLYFAIANLTETDLSLIYLSGNGTLEFSRVN